MNQAIDLRLSSLRMGTKANPRLVWSLGVHKEFISQIPEADRNARIEQSDGRLRIKIGEDGVKLSDRNRGNFAYATSLGEHHLTGLTTASREMPAQHLKGVYHPETHEIEVTSELPDLVRETFVDIVGLKESAEPEHNFPATHFQEDVSSERAAHADLTDIDDAKAWYQEQVRLSQKRVHTVQVDMTPELATVLLEHNDGNRPVRQAKLNQYISDINADRWDFNGETIIISKEGLVNNGQHRSLAVLDTQKAIPVLFVFGVERASRRTVDTGANRGAHDHLSVDGFTQPTTLAALTRFLIAYERNDGQNFANLNRVTAAEIYERAKTDKMLDLASQFPYKHGNKSKRLAPPSVIGFCYYVMSQADKDAADTFMGQVITGIGLDAQSPAYVTREKLLELSSLVREQKVEVLMRGFMAFRKGKPIRSIRIKWELPKL